MSRRVKMASDLWTGEAQITQSRSLFKMTFHGTWSLTSRTVASAELSSESIASNLPTRSGSVFRELAQNILGLNPAAASSQDFSEFLISLSARQQDQLRTQIGNREFNQMLYLAQESDPVLFYSGLLNLGQTFLRQDKPSLAFWAFETVSHSNDSVSNPHLVRLRRRALSELSRMQGEGSWGERLEFYGGRFLQQAVHPANVFGMMVGQMVFAPARAWILGRLFRAPTGFLTRGLGARALASTLALGLEVPAFWGASKGIQSLMHPGVVAWDLDTNLRELSGLGMTLGVLRLVGFGSRAALNWANRSITVPGMAAPAWVQPAQLAVGPSSAIGGLYLAHWGEERLGFREGQNAGDRLFDSFVTFLEFSVAGRLAHGLLGQNFALWQNQLEQRLQWQSDRLTSPPSADGSTGGYSGQVGPRYALANHGSGVSVAGLAGAGPRPAAPMAMSSLGKGGDTSAPPASSPRPMLPAAGESAEGYAHRLMQASRRDNDQLHLQLAQGLETVLADPAREAFSRNVLATLRELAPEGTPEGSGLVMRDYSLPGLSQPLTILSLPTTFLPENWSLFYARRVMGEIERAGRPVHHALELGSGTGWLAIYLAKRGMVQQVTGVDYTASAPHVSRINALINGVSNVEFYQSDLLQSVPDQVRFDLVLGCLPQVPSPGALTERGFADYFPDRNNVMKPYGLGLNYDALAQARNRLSDGGRTLLNLAGRPGLENLLEMHRLAGYHPVVRHHEVIPQDGSTDISPLAELESNFGVRFEFLHPQTGNPLSAREALAVPGVQHHQYLIEGRPYRHFFQKAVLGPQGLAHRARWGYTLDTGSEHGELRQEIANQFSRELGVPLSEETIFLGPAYQNLLEGLLKVTAPPRSRILLVGESLPRTQRAATRLQGVTVEEIPSDLAQTAQAIRNEKFSVAVLSLNRLSWNRSAELRELLEMSSTRGTKVIIVEPHLPRDASGSNPLSHVLNVNNTRVLENTILLQPLDLRYSLENLPLSAAFIGSLGIHRLLAHYGELTYSRASTPLQEAYLRMLQAVRQEPEYPGSMGLPQNAEPLEVLLTAFNQDSPVHRALNEPGVFSSIPSGPSRKGPVIDMSFGESEWNAPVEMTHAYERALRKPYHHLYQETQAEVSRYLLETRGVDVSLSDIVLVPGVHPGVAETIRGLRQVHRATGQRVYLPQGSYGHFYPTPEVMGAEVTVLPTQAYQNYLLEPQVLSPKLARGQNGGRTHQSLLINVPTNPGGQYYSEAQLRDISRVLRRFRGTLLFDDVFGMTGMERVPYLRSPHLGILRQAMGEDLVYFGGVSKEFAAGGLRLGWVVSENAGLVKYLRGEEGIHPDPFALAMGQEYLLRWEDLLPRHQQHLLYSRRQLETFFIQHRMPVVSPQGGFALLVNLTGLYGRLYKTGSTVIPITPENLHLLLYSEAGIKVNRPEWSQTPGHYRFVFAIDNIEAAVDRLKGFFRRAHSPFPH